MPEQAEIKFLACPPASRFDDFVKLILADLQGIGLRCRENALAGPAPVPTVPFSMIPGKKSRLPEPTPTPNGPSRL